MMPRHDDGVSTLGYRTRELHVTPLLADLFKTRGFKTTLDLAEAERLKPPQPLPRFGAPSEDAGQPAARSAVAAPHANFREPLLQFGPDWRHRHPGIGKRTILPRA